LSAAVLTTRIWDFADPITVRAALNESISETDLAARIGECGLARLHV
jgi:hypothetical protein